MQPYDYDNLLLPVGMEEKERLCVIYHPDCGCEVDFLVVLDHYPMTEKVHAKCHQCKKYCFLEISDPIVFHLPLLNQDWSLEDLKKAYITDSDQKEFILAYTKK